MIPISRIFSDVLITGFFSNQLNSGELLLNSEIRSASFLRLLSWFFSLARKKIARAYLTVIALSIMLSIQFYFIDQLTHQLLMLFFIGHFIPDNFFSNNKR